MKGTVNREQGTGAGRRGKRVVRSIQRANENGMRAMVGEMVLWVVRDLATLRKRGMWVESPEEVRERYDALSRAGDGGQCLRVCGGVAFLSATQGEYLRGICRVAGAALGVNLSVGQIVEAAKRFADQGEGGLE